MQIKRYKELFLLKKKISLKKIINCQLIEESLFHFLIRFFKMLSKNPWPFMSSFCSMLFLFNLVRLFNKNLKIIFLVSRLTIMILTIFFWFKEIVKESILGAHNSFMNRMFNFGMMTFILSEVCFFFRFFWAFFYKSIKPLNWESKFLWPPFDSIDSWSVPFLNTIILLSSGVTLTWAHHKLINSNGFYNFFLIHLGFFFTIFFGFFFEALQFEEYIHNFFSLNSTIYGSRFYMLTGFHGFHVLIGLLILLICWIRLFFFSYNKNRHQKFLLGAWYWHFVDVVWLFLFIFVYLSFQTISFFSLKKIFLLQRKVKKFLKMDF